MPKWPTATVILVVCAGPFACQRQEPLYVFAKAGLYREWAPATTVEGPVILEVIVGRRPRRRGGGHSVGSDH